MRRRLRRVHARPLHRQQLHVHERSPARVQALASSGGESVDTGMVATGGATLAMHVESADTGDGAGVEAVELRRPSGAERDPVDRAVPRAGDVPGRAPARLHGPRCGRAAGVLPDVGTPRRLARGRAARLRGMQSAIDDGYLTIAGEQRAAVAPVGYAWWTLLRRSRQPISGWTTTPTRRRKARTCRRASSTRPSSTGRRSACTITRPAGRRSRDRAGGRVEGGPRRSGEVGVGPILPWRA